MKAKGYRPLYMAGPLRVHGSYISAPFYIGDNKGTLAYRARVSKLDDNLVVELIDVIQIDEEPEENELHTSMYELDSIVKKAFTTPLEKDSGQCPALVSIYNYYDDLNRNRKYIFVYCFLSTRIQNALLNIYTLKDQGDMYVGTAVIVCLGDLSSECKLYDAKSLEIKFTKPYKASEVYSLTKVFHTPRRLLQSRGKAEVKTYPLFVSLIVRLVPVVRGAKVSTGLYEEYLVGGHVISEPDGIARFVPSPGLLKFMETQGDWGFIPKVIMRDIAIININYDLTEVYENLVKFYEKVLDKVLELSSSKHQEKEAVSVGTARQEILIEDPKVTLKSISDNMFYSLLCSDLDVDINICRRAAFLTAPLNYRELLRLDKGIADRLPVPFANGHAPYLSPAGEVAYLVSQVNLERLVKIHESVERLFTHYGTGDTLHNQAIIVRAAVEVFIENLRRLEKTTGSRDVSVKSIDKILQDRELSKNIAGFLATKALVMGLHALSNTAILGVGKMFGLQRHPSVNNVLSEFVGIAVTRKYWTPDKAIKLIRKNNVEGIVVDGVLGYMADNKGHTMGGFTLIVKYEGSALMAKTLSDTLSDLDDKVCEDLLYLTGSLIEDRCYTDWLQRRGVYEYNVYEVLRSINTGHGKVLGLRPEDFLKRLTTTIRVKGSNELSPHSDVFPPFNTARRIVEDRLREFESKSGTRLPYTVRRLLDAITLARVPYCFDGCYACVAHDGCAYRFYGLRLIQTSKYMAKFICKNTIQSNFSTDLVS